jgi:hypothetical protein
MNFPAAAMLSFSDARLAALLVAKITAFGVFVSSLEYLARPKLLADYGLMSWAVGQVRVFWLVSGNLAGPLNRCLQYPNFLFLLAVRALLCLSMFSAERVLL